MLLHRCYHMQICAPLYIHVYKQPHNTTHTYTHMSYIVHVKKQYTQSSQSWSTAYMCTSNHTHTHTYIHCTAIHSKQSVIFDVRNWAALGDKTCGTGWGSTLAYLETCEVGRITSIGQILLYMYLVSALNIHMHFFHHLCTANQGFFAFRIPPKVAWCTCATSLTAAITCRSVPHCTHVYIYMCMAIT